MKAREMGVRLSGTRNQCPACDALFNSVSAFDLHRVGPHGKRRCLGPLSMLEIGMVLGEDSFWRTKRMEERTFPDKIVKPTRWTA